MSIQVKRRFRAWFRFEPRDVSSGVSANRRVRLVRFTGTHASIAHSLQSLRRQLGIVSSSGRFLVRRNHHSRHSGRALNRTVQLQQLHRLPSEPTLELCPCTSPKSRTVDEDPPTPNEVKIAAAAVTKLLRVANFLLLNIKYSIQKLLEVDLLNLRILRTLQGILVQDFQGHITVLPSLTFKDYCIHRRPTERTRHAPIHPTRHSNHLGAHRNNQAHHGSRNGFEKSHRAVNRASENG